MSGRRIGLDILYNNQDITADIDGFVSTVSFSDNLSGAADDISIALADRERKWMNAWIPKMGASIEASILISEGWDSDKQAKRKLGYFEIDDLGIDGPPLKVDVKGISIPESSSLRGTKKTKAWENTNLKKIASDIATANGLRLYFSVQDNPSYDRVDQEWQSDVVFLTKICADNGFSVKVANKSITILDDNILESKQEIDTISRTDKSLKRFNGRFKQTDIYKSCRVAYTDTKKKKTFTVVFTPKKPPATGRILEVNEEVTSEAAAMKLAKKKLREANKEAMTFSIVMSGFKNYYAGQTLKINGFGSFDGKYLITNFSGSIGSGSETSLELRKCLEGY
ncbi:hypothetical protein HMPREF1013_00831 [Bacillus sp. 2_A_57_CT2]|nr:hypothetical protein HMPREF1013_00831 [Bacillus sp. 2_A_57_CT2]